MSGFTVNTEMAGTAQAMTTTPKTLCRVVCPATLMRRVRYTELEVSAISVPNATDCQIQADLAYCSATAAGTPSAATPLSLDSGAAVALDVSVSTGGVNYNGEPTTFTANVWFARGFNQRSGVLWQASPDKPIIMPALASVGACLRALSSNYTGGCAGKVFFDEL